jgi:hypothetical protein
MDDMQRDAGVPPESPTTESGENRETGSTALGARRSLANPRRVRRA